MKKLNVAVIFGGRSTEHEISILTALQAIRALDKSKYRVLPVYVSKAGKWVLGDQKLLKLRAYKDLEAIAESYPSTHLEVGAAGKSYLVSNLFGFLPRRTVVDVVLPTFHGTFGEDGVMQGIFESVDVPYVGSGVLGSALGMDKAIQKEIFKTLGIPQVKYVWFYKGDWNRSKEEVLNSVKHLKFPLFVKPANGGSSVGITVVKSQKDLVTAIEVAATYDRKIVVEEDAGNCRDVNISILGTSGGEIEFSPCEQPVKSSQFLTYKDKYESGDVSQGMAGLSRILPAPIAKRTEETIKKYAKAAFVGLDLSGLVRIDFLVSADEKRVLVGEVNTLPGSLAYYLWEAAGLTFSEMLDRLIEIAIKKHREKASCTYTFASNILANVDKGVAGGKFGKTALGGKFDDLS